MKFVYSICLFVFLFVTVYVIIESNNLYQHGGFKGQLNPELVTLNKMEEEIRPQKLTFSKFYP